MSQTQQRTSRPPVEYWFIVGLGLSASGLFYAAIAVVAWYFFLKRRQPRMDWELLMVASGYLGIATVRIFQILLMRENPYRMTEHVILSAAALMLLFSQRRGWAWFLLVASALGALIWFLSAALGITKHTSAQFMVLAGLIDLLWIWLLAHWLRRTKKREVTDAPKIQRYDAPNRG
jgi:ABC-type Fe3+-siderophore transport system permease subunit